MAELVIGWQAGPTERGTLTLVYSCLATIFTCTWTVLHLNVPGLHDGALTKALRKAKWMAITILFPEFVFSKAVCDLRLALSNLREFGIELEERYKYKLQWSVKWEDIMYGQNHEHIYSWQVDYGPRARLLYWVLGLQSPYDGNRPAEKIGERGDTEQTQTSSRDEEEQGTSQHTAQEEQLQSGHPETGSRRNSQEGVRHRSDSRGSASNHTDNSIGIKQVASPRDSGRVATSVEKGAPGGHEDLREQLPVEDEGLCGNSNDSLWAIQPTGIKYYTTQNWTLTHALFANAGGLLYHHISQDSQDGHESLPYYAISGTKLGPLYFWVTEHHPLRGLVLSKQDIEDKSKADWLLKSFTVLQVTWLVLTVLVRAGNRLLVTQLEIATVAFSVSAVATYVANWWTPKDVSQPIRIQKPAMGGGKAGEIIPAQKLVGRLINLSKTETQKVENPDDHRVQNDVTWIEEGVPLIFSIMAVSSLLFGGLHLIAWNFEFPSQAELVLWRVSSLTATALPLFSLGLSLWLNNLATTYPYKRITSFWLEMLKPLDAFPEGFWNEFHNPAFISFDCDKLHSFYFTPAGSRNFNEKPSRPLSWDHGTQDPYFQNTVGFAGSLRDIHYSRKRTEEQPLNAERVHAVAFNLSYLEKLCSDGGLEFWEDFESYLREKYTASGASLPETKCISYLSGASSRFKEGCNRLEAERRAFDRASRFLLISTGTLYAASRLIILVLLFTSLRSVPKGVYDNTPWTRFLPSFS
ncbi:hypothetical protein F4808DRAFT_463499 [Astrocystis sublimbata]|nr:hypothetical protein F4808DRAFT_463499 [Astrocystis sublimbata]